MTTRATSASLPKFVTLSHELGKQEGHSQIHDSGAAFRFEAPMMNLLHSMQELQIGGTGAATPAAGKQIP
jgi:hypothetical protein